MLLIYFQKIEDYFSYLINYFLFINLFRFYFVIQRFKIIFVFKFLFVIYVKSLIINIYFVYLGLFFRIFGDDEIDGKMVFVIRNESFFVEGFIEDG